MTKVILDIGFLGHAQDEKSERRGAQRVAQHLFEGLAPLDQYELRFVATTHLAGAYDFLVAKGIDASERLYLPPGQLRLSRAGRAIGRRVRRTIEDRSLPARFRRRVMAEVGHRCIRGEGRVASGWLDHADIYHSPHAPYPAAIHNHARIKKFLTLHDFIPLKNPEYFPGASRPFMDAVLACLTRQNFAFCVSETTRNDALNLSRIPPEHVFVTPLAADGNVFYRVSDAVQLAATRTRHGIPDGPYLLALSSQDRHKNFPHLIHCFGSIVESGELSDTSLVIAGANPGRNPQIAEALAKYPRARKRIILAGYVPDDDLAAVYSGATAFLFPSLAEGFGIPPLEAMQCGTPVIASNTTSIPEVVGDAGILLPPTEQDVWCHAILELCRNEKRRDELRVKSLQRSKLFTWKRFIDETLRGYQTSLELK